MEHPDKRFAVVCRLCGSANVSRDAWADWDIERQAWVLGAVFDYAHCHACDTETSLDEAPLVGTCG